MTNNKVEMKDGKVRLMTDDELFIVWTMAEDFVAKINDNEPHPHWWIGTPTTEKPSTGVNWGQDGF